MALLAAVAVLAAVLDAVFAARPAAAAAAPVPNPALGVVISAHRAGAAQWPQDSLRAFRHALAAGYHDIEGDAYLTRDGVAVIYHDATISSLRCPGPYAGRRIWRLTAKQVATVRCEKQPIPTEAQVLRAFTASPNRTAVLRLEAKAHVGQSATKARAEAKAIAAMVVKAGLARRAIMQDFDWAGLPAFKSASPLLRTSALISRPTAADLQRAKALGAYDLSYNALYATPTLKRAIRAARMRATVWGGDPVPPRTPSSPSSTDQAAAVTAFRKAVCAGARTVITNFPAALIASTRAGFTC